MMYMKSVSGIYSITNKINNYMYVGQSINVYQRLKNHLNSLQLNKHENEYLQRAWNKYGKEAFEFKLIKACKPKYLNRFEKLYIKKYNSYHNGYNNTIGGDNPPVWTGKHIPLDAKIKISKSVNTSGIFRIRKEKRIDCKQGFIWRYRYIDKGGKDKSISSVDINKLKKKVIDLNLPWIEL